MPYSKQHKPQSRERILRSALRLFSVKGFDQITIDRVMADAGLTRGAFYAHFSSKEELYSEAIRHGIRTSALVEVPPKSDGLSSLRQIIETYLSHGHVEGVDFTCPIAFFARDVGVREKKVRDTYTSALRSLTGVLAAHLPHPIEDDQLLAMTILMVGGVAISSGLTDRDLRDQILMACRSTILEIASTKPKTGKKRLNSSKTRRQRLPERLAAS